MILFLQNFASVRTGRIESHMLLLRVPHFNNFFHFRHSALTFRNKIEPPMISNRDMKTRLTPELVIPELLLSLVSVNVFQNVELYSLSSLMMNGSFFNMLASSMGFFVRIINFVMSSYNQKRASSDKAQTLVVFVLIDQRIYKHWYIKPCKKTLNEMSATGVTQVFVSNRVFLRNA